MSQVPEPEERWEWGRWVKAGRHSKGMWGIGDCGYPSRGRHHCQLSAELRPYSEGSDGDMNTSPTPVPHNDLQLCPCGLQQIPRSRMGHFPGLPTDRWED